MKAFDRGREPHSRADIFRGLRIRNQTGSTITAGQIVYVSSWSETYKRFLVSLADADLAGASKALFVVRNPITTGQNGVGWKTHRLINQNTSAASAAGDPVYLSATAGGWTLTAPAASGGVNHIIGRVAVDHASAGEIEFNLELDTAESSTTAVSLEGLVISGVRAGATDGCAIRAGTSAAKLTDDTANMNFVAGHFDSGATSGWNNGAYFKMYGTGINGSYTALEGDMDISVRSGNVTGIESFTSVSSGGYVTGGLSSCVGTVDFANAALAGGGGWYRGAIFNIKGEGAATDPSGAQCISCLELKTEGTWSTAFEALADSFSIVWNGFTSAAGTGKILSSTIPGVLSGLGAVRGIRVGANDGAIDTPPTAYYIPLIPSTAWTAISAATLLTDDTAGSVFMNYSFDCGATSGDVKGLSVTLAATGVLQTYSTAVYGNCAPSVQVRNPVGVQGDLNFGSAGWIQGLGYAIGGYAALPGATVAATGNFAVANFELSATASGVYTAPTRMSMLRLAVGGDATALQTFERTTAAGCKGVAISLVGFTAGDSYILNNKAVTANAVLDGCLGLRVGIGTGGGGDAFYYIPLVPQAEWA